MGGIVAAGLNYRGAERSRRAAADQARERKQYFEGLNWDPEYVSSHVQPYQRSSSPVARGYLESMLTGASPDMIRGTAPGAGAARSNAALEFARQYGSHDQQLGQERQALSQQPWAVKRFTGLSGIGGDNAIKDLAALKRAMGAANVDVDDLYAAANSGGKVITPGSGVDRARAEEAANARASAFKGSPMAKWATG